MFTPRTCFTSVAGDAKWVASALQGSRRWQPGSEDGVVRPRFVGADYLALAAATLFTATYFGAALLAGALLAAAAARLALAASRAASVRALAALVLACTVAPLIDFATASALFVTAALTVLTSFAIAPPACFTRWLAFC